MLGSPTRLCRHFFEQHMKSRLAVFRNGLAVKKPLRKTANRLFICCFWATYGFYQYLMMPSLNIESWHPISTFDVGWQPEILSPIARLPAGLYYSILSPQNMRAFQRTGSRLFSNEKLPQSHSISSILLNLPF